MIFDVMKANDKNDHDAADIVCQECKSIIATLHGPNAQRPSVRSKRAAKAREMASQEIEHLSDPSATDEERQRRKRRLLKGPKEFRDIRGNRPEFKSSGPTYPRSHSRRGPAGPNLCERCSSGVSATAAEDRAAPLYFQPDFCRWDPKIQGM
jgi:hypothetical protein